MIVEALRKNSITICNQSNKSELIVLNNLNIHVVYDIFHLMSMIMLIICQSRCPLQS